MQYIQTACLLNLIISSVFMGPKHEPFNFTLDRINNHRRSFSKEYEYNDAQFLLQLSLMVTEHNYYNKQLDSISWLNNIELSYNECPLSLISQGLSNTILNESKLLGHIFYNESNVIIIFTGTVNACMGGLDLSYNQVELDAIKNYVPGSKAHKGIYLAYKSVREQLVREIKPLLNDRQLVISGHSLGGALSQLCALDLAYYEPIHYSFASPMIFNSIGYEIFTRLVQNSYRVANISDLVTSSPLPVMPNKDAFLHTGTLVSFQRNLGEYSANHTKAYIDEYELIQ